LSIPDAPVGTPNDMTEYFKLMFDLMAWRSGRHHA
jgi:hypothetical protein